MGTLFVDKLDPQSGTSLEIGSSGDTITVPSGCTITNNGTNGGGFGLREIETPYAARIFTDTSQSIPDSTTTALDFASGTSVFDKGSIGTLSNGRITVPTGAGGLWWLSGQARVNNFRAARNRLSIYKNGGAISASIADVFEKGYMGASGQYQNIAGTWLINATAGDYFTLHFYQNSGGADTIIDRSFFAWYLGSAT